MNALFGFLGRTTFALIFILAGVQKFQTFEPASGGPYTLYITPKLNNILAAVQQKTGVALPVDQSTYRYIIPAVAALEVVGGILFVVDLSMGAWLLLLFLAPVTTIMHDFWNLPPSSAEQQVEMMMFMKNVTILGGLIIYLSRPTPTVLVGKKND